MSGKYKSLTGDQLYVGMSAEKAMTITDEDISKFGDVSRDHNPMHFDEAFAKNTQFGGIIAHGLISLACCGSVMAEELPGMGAVHLGQTATFKAPVYPGDTITCRCEVIDIKDKSKFYIIQIKETVTNQNGVVVIEGVATIMPPVTAVEYSAL